MIGSSPDEDTEPDIAWLLSCSVSIDLASVRPRS